MVHSIWRPSSYPLRPGPSIRGRSFSELRGHGIVKSRTSPYNLRCNGQTERFNRTYYAHWPLRKSDAVQVYTGVESWYSTTPHSATSVSPYVLIFGRDVSLPIDCIYKRSSTST
ncbi:Pol polyprotein [Plakobranchus ocellatus]|uniref:Pol polyprotein n=1 Tax=Plakobranchus ocellatus TaxID=259542 RepID=A0AAV3ZX74_9GAST|nr:Pol polyprotein [Plakobranchus ocellatus]